MRTISVKINNDGLDIPLNEVVETIKKSIDSLGVSSEVELDRSYEDFQEGFTDAELEEFSKTVVLVP